MIPELRDLSYENSLFECGLTTLRGDQIEAFKIVNGCEDIDGNVFFKLREGSRTREYKTALLKVGHEKVLILTEGMFKNRIDKYLIKAGYRGKVGNMSILVT